MNIIPDKYRINRYLKGQKPGGRNALLPSRRRRMKEKMAGMVGGCKHAPCNPLGSLSIWVTFDEICNVPHDIALISLRDTILYYENK